MKPDAEIILQLKTKLRSANLKSTTSKFEKVYQAYKADPTWYQKKALEHAIYNAVLEILDSELSSVITPQKLWGLTVEVYPFLPKKKDHFVNQILPKCRQHGIQSYLLSMMDKMKKAKNAQKCTEEHLTLIKGYYIKNEQATAIDVYRELQMHFTTGLKAISHSIVKTIIRNNKHVWDYLKYPGLIAEHEKKAVLISASNPLTQIQIDGSTLAYPYWDDRNNIINQLVFFIVVDDYSGKIIGWSIDDSENITMVMDALEMAFRVEGNMAGHSGILPGEIKSDNASAFSTPRYKIFKELCESYGHTEFTKQKAGKPTGKSEVEFAVKRVQEMLKFDSGMIGLGIKSKSRTSRKSDQSLTEARRKKNLPNKEYVIGRIAYAIDKYNTLAVSGKQTPSELFANLDRPYATPVDLAQMNNLFWDRAKAKVKPSGQFSFKYRNTTYYYEIENSAIEKLHQLRNGKGAGRGLQNIIVRFRHSQDGDYMKTVNCYDFKNPTIHLFNAKEQPKQRKAKKERDLYDKVLSDSIEEENRMVANGYNEQRKVFDAKSLEATTTYQMGKDNLKRAEDAVLRSQYSERFKGSGLAVESQSSAERDDTTVTKQIRRFKKPTLLE